ncbi:NADH-quinone oxidoreductase subunit A [Desulfuromonas acetoxidans]|jgi:NADH-quinone oxidoreductase subunit A|uniref:NADH-quinone oxidoreductase subunit n=1 Tax=Desulfuromonas acetoxidans (strain DSM 684 / 11070) TaxID=281689 RepID=Q1K3R1_DESA6|nr:NADH-quinone oxidoreductase subunit A [Desulfuromonas acetoxidans]EAT17392.1 NADH-ubiquinone/plastoquinone oxidoreductase, chain 3 [Desulfuromonas acetoxidans DSM 684]MBF0644224.1 NADH-quinone oxidoreductase subunit A [Desulfuromonas acetoxidans]NVD24906.1 NADH-quinone oxidoreductase subunit A [Desulfuromonas acetoxidans]NVE15207.1 NADH-quinone oxidoreductase subunit A [Desulfuromonas acetoxidans]
MAEQYLVDYVYVLVFLIAGIACGLGPLVISRLLAPRVLFRKTLEPYECGMDPYGSAWNIRFDIAYYLYALIFLAFDVDVLYLFPVATAFDKVSAVRGITELVIFVGILSLAVVYAWVKGVFTWPKRKVC